MQGRLRLAAVIPQNLVDAERLVGVQVLGNIQKARDLHDHHDRAIGMVATAVVLLVLLLHGVVDRHQPAVKRANDLVGAIRHAASTRASA